MAHSDFNCCAICDCKLDYSIKAKSKGKICSHCDWKLRENEVYVDDVGDLYNWMKMNANSKVARLLEKIGFRYCSRKNKIDKLAREMDIEEIEND